MKRIFSIIVAFAASLSLAFGQIEVSVHNVVSLGENFNVEFSVSDDRPTDFKWTAPSGLDLVWGPSQGSSISIINGKKSSSYTFTYTLIASREGEFEIPAATARQKGRQISSKPVKIRVVKGSAQAGSSSARPSASATVGPEDLFLRLTLDRRSVVVGEPVKADLKLYKKVQISGFEDVHFPAFTGFWSQETYAAQNIEFRRETLGEEIYEVALLRSYSLIPQQVGDLVIDPAEIVCLVAVRAPSTGRSIFDSFFESDYRTIRKRIATKEETVRVKPLPQPQPDSFCGGVGEYEVKAQLSKDSLLTHEAASLIVTVSGKGNLALLEAPKVRFPADFDKYDVKVREEGDKKIFEYPFIPRSHGEFLIEGVPFTFYSPAARDYRTVLTAPLSLAVGRNAEALESGQVQSFSGLVARDVRDLGTDVRFIRTALPSFRKAGSFFVFSPLFFVLMVVLLLLFAVVLIIGRRLSNSRADVQGARKKKASKMARARLKKAGEFLQSGLQAAFYEELHRALLGFVSDALSMDAAELDKDNISSRLKAAGATPDDASSFVALIETCEYARYAPVSAEEGMNQHYESALNLISSIDDDMKHGKNPHAASVVAIVLALGSLSVNGFAQVDEESLWKSGVEAYVAADYEASLQNWLQIESAGLCSAQLCYNIGDAYFKMGDPAKAVLYFERALKIDPSFADAKVNLAFTRAFLQDRIESVPEFFVVGWVRSLRHTLSSDEWAVVSIVLFAMLLAMIVLFLRGRGASSRKGGFFAGIAAALLWICALGFASSSRSEALSTDGAIVVSPVSLVRSAPDSRTGTDLFVLHEGAKVEILDSVGEWFNISLADGRQGWIKSSEIEII